MSRCQVCGQAVATVFVDSNRFERCVYCHSIEVGINRGMPPASSDDKLNEVRRLVVDWLSKQGHDACWYYPDVFRQIASVLGIATPPVSLPTRSEFETGCKQYQNELYSGDSERNNVA